MLYKVTGRAKRNWVKLKCLYYLQRAYVGHSGDWVSVSRLANGTNSNIGSLYVLLPRWGIWDLVEVQNMGTPLEPQWGYRITPRGRAYLKSASKWYPLLEEVVDEVNTAGRKMVHWFDGQDTHVIIEPFASKTDYFLVPGRDHVYGMSVRGPESMLKVAKLFGYNVSELFQEYVLDQLKAK